MLFYTIYVYIDICLPANGNWGALISTKVLSQMFWCWVTLTNLKGGWGEAVTERCDCEEKDILVCNTTKVPLIKTELNCHYDEEWVKSWMTVSLRVRVKWFRDRRVSLQNLTQCVWAIMIEWMVFVVGKRKSLHNGSYPRPTCINLLFVW